MVVCCRALHHFPKVLFEYSYVGHTYDSVNGKTQDQRKHKETVGTELMLFLRSLCMCFIHLLEMVALACSAGRFQGSCLVVHCLAVFPSPCLSNCFVTLSLCVCLSSSLLVSFVERLPTTTRRSVSSKYKS